MLVRVHVANDGSVLGVTRPVTKRYTGESDTDYLNRTAPTLGATYIDVEQSSLPDPSTRDSWQVVDGVVVAGD